MTIDCGNCGARYNIQDGLIPPQGARVRCKKCASMIAIPPPNVTELAAQDLELIPPTPESPRDDAPGGPTDDAASSGFERSTPPEPLRATRPPDSDMALESYPQEPPPEASAAETESDEPEPVGFEAVESSTTESPTTESPTAEPPMAEPSMAEPATGPAEDDAFERAGATPRYGSPPSFAEASPAAPSSYGATMTVEPPEMQPVEASAGSESLAATDDAAPSNEEAEASAQAPAAVAAPSSVPSGTPLPQGLSPEERSAHEKARRLARVLASDIAIYNRDKKERGMREGNLVAMLGYEIKKSWEIYKERVGSDFANSTPYFRDALNEMLAEGKKIF